MKDPSKGGPHPKHAYALPDPYPTPRVIGKNPYYASILLEDYAGLPGELTAINQYIYHYLTLKHFHPSIATLCRQVAIVEMHHLELLGETIKLLGTLPLLHSPGSYSMNFWSADCVYYGESLYDKLSANINHELTAIHNYKIHQQYIDDPFVNKLLERIILDEEYHLWLFSTCRDEFCNSFD